MFGVCSTQTLVEIYNKSFPPEFCQNVDTKFDHSNLIQILNKSVALKVVPVCKANQAFFLIPLKEPPVFSFAVLKPEKGCFTGLETGGKPV